MKAIRSNFRSLSISKVWLRKGTAVALKFNKRTLLLIARSFPMYMTMKAPNLRRLKIISA